jgi:hypothetical protein
MAPREIWEALGLSRHAGIIEKRGSKKTGRYLAVNYPAVREQIRQKFKSKTIQG